MKKYKVISIAISALIISAYALFAWSYAYNAPQEDDIPALMRFCLEFKPHHLSNWKFLIKPNNEHIIPIAKLISWLYVKITGQINFFYLTVFGNLIVLGGWIVWILKKLPKDNRWLYAGLATLFICNPQYQASSLWTLGIWTNVLVLPLAGLCISAWVQNRLFAATMLALVCASANGNGLAILPISLVYLTVGNYSTKSKLFAGLTITIYLVGYIFILKQVPSATGTQVFYIPNTIEKVAMMPVNIFAFLGSFIAYGSTTIDYLFSVTMGFLLTAFWVLQNWNKKNIYNNEKGKALTGILYFIICTAIIVTAFRSEKDIGVIVSGRYRLYSCSFTCILIIMYAKRYLASQKTLSEHILVLTMQIIGLGWLWMIYPKQIGGRLAQIWKLKADAINLENGYYPQLKENDDFSYIFVKSLNDKIYFMPYDLANLKKMCLANVMENSEIPTSIELKKDNKENDPHICLNYINIAGKDLTAYGTANGGIYSVSTLKNWKIVLCAATVQRTITFWPIPNFKRGFNCRQYTCNLPQIENSEIISEMDNKKFSLNKQ